MSFPNIRELTLANLPRQARPLRLAVQAAVWLTVFGLAAWWWWDARWDLLRQQDAMLEEHRAALAAVESRVVALQRLATREAALVEIGSSLDQALPREARWEALLIDLEDISRDASGRLQHFKPGTESPADPGSMQLPVQIRLFGGYPALGGFVGALNGLPRVVTLDRLQVRADRNSGSLSAEFVASAYRYVGQAGDDAPPIRLAMPQPARRSTLDWAPSGDPFRIAVRATVAPPAAVASADAPSPIAAPKPALALIGVLQRGGKREALLRASSGEVLRGTAGSTLGASGWQLLSVDESSVRVRRPGGSEASLHLNDNID